ncbi:hypothetical protein Dimus_021816 [Dionaea muscipula]
MDGHRGSRGKAADPKKKSKESSSVRPKNEPLTVKYISSPIMVSAKTESEFRAVVQELTGKDADAGGNQSSRPHIAESSSSVLDQTSTPGKDGDTYSPGLDHTFWTDFSKDQY